jgi:hypothetical protein
MSPNVPTLNARAFLKEYSAKLPPDCHIKDQYTMPTWTGWVIHIVYGLADNRYRVEREQPVEPSYRYKPDQGGIDLALFSLTDGKWLLAMEHENLTDPGERIKDYAKVIRAPARVRLFVGYAKTRASMKTVAEDLRDLYPSLIGRLGPGPEDETVISISCLAPASPTDAWIAYLRGPHSKREDWKVVPFEQFIREQ